VSACAQCSHFLVRSQMDEFNPIVEDVSALAAHCGSLGLDPTVVSEVMHELATKEMIFTGKEFSFATSFRTLSRPVLEEA